jgi:tetratricopeptide (TPR) repeat protein
MDRRKAVLLAGGLLCGLAGCTKTVTTPAGQVPLATKAAVPSAPSPDAVVTKREVLGDPKPATYVQMGAVRAELAADPNRSQADREAFAQQAKDAFNKALKADPKYIPAHMALGSLNESLGVRDEALANYRTVVSLEPKNTAAHVACARVFEAAGQRDQAVATYAAATAAMPRDAALWFEMGMCYGRAKQFELALNCLTKAAELRPNNPDYAKATGFMLARMDRREDALNWFAKAMSEANAHYNLALVLRHIGRDDASREHLAAALRLEPNHEGALKLAADAGAKPAPDAPVRTAAAVSSDPPSPVQQASHLPTRPLVIHTAGAEPPRPLPPLIPVVTDQFDAKPTAPSLTDAAPKTETKKPTITIGFDPGQ